MRRFRLALAQINSTVGDYSGNAARVVEAAKRAAEAEASIVVFPELCLSGYPPEDLLLKPHFIEDSRDCLDQIAAEIPEDLTCLIGTPMREDPSQSKPTNAAAILSGGRVIAHYAKRHLPNYGVFDEKRLFASGSSTLRLLVGSVRLGVHICEDSWVPEDPGLSDLRTLGLSAMLNLSASPFHSGKQGERVEVLQQTAAKVNAPMVYCNLVGGQDELVFDGGSMVLAPDGEILARGKFFEEDLLLIDLPVVKSPDTVVEGNEPSPVEWVVLREPRTAPVNVPLPPRIEPEGDRLENIYKALCLGIRDYTDKNGFKSVLVAISGGIDSALVAALAVDALGPDRVKGISLPTQYSSDGTKNDAHALAKNLSIDMDMLSIQGLFDEFLGVLAPRFDGRDVNVTEENLQARIRGTLVMALSNKFGHLVVATGNKSEMAVGYCTLYGDMCGGYALIKDVPKTTVFDLCRWINQHKGRERIPTDTISRPPSAELRPDQKDSDSLPDYDELDGILELYVEKDKSLDEIVAAGFDPQTVQRVLRLVDLNEYKRRQAPPGVKITPKAFGRDRRVPITNRYRPT